MEFSSLFPVWNRLTAEQQAALSGSVFSRKVNKGDVIHNGDADCTGLLLVRSGQVFHQFPSWHLHILLKGDGNGRDIIHLHIQTILTVAVLNENQITFLG